MELVRRAYESFNAGGAEGTVPFLDPAVVWDESAFPARNPGIYRGHEGVRQLARENAELWSDIGVEIESLVEAGERVVALVRVKGRGRFTGEVIELAIAQVWEVRDGRASRVTLYLDRDEALEAAAG